MSDKSNASTPSSTPSPTRAKSQECKPRFAVTLIPRYTHASKDLLQDGSGSTSPSAKTKKGCKPGQGKKVKKHVTKASLLHCLSLYYIAIPSGGLTGRPKPKRSQQPRPHRRQLPPQQQQAHPRTHGFEARPLRTPNVVVMHDSLISTCTVEHSFSYYVLQQERRAEATIGRMCTPTRRSGAVAAPPSVRAEYAAGGVRRNRIIQQFLAAGGDKDCRCCEGVLCPIWPTLNPINPKPYKP